MAVDLGEVGVDLGEVEKAPRRGAPAGKDLGRDLGEEEPSYFGAMGTMLKQAVPHLAGGVMESVGDIVGAEATSPYSEKPSRGIWQDSKDILGRMAGEIPQKGVLGTAMGVATMPARVLHQTAGEVAARVLPEEVRQGGKDLALYGAQVGDAAREAVTASRPDDLNWVQDASLSAVNSLAMTIPGLVASRAGVISPATAMKGTLGAFGVSSYGTSYNEARAEGADPSTAFQSALPKALVEIGTEKMALDTLLKGGKGWFPKFLAQEVGSEEVATIAQAAIEKGLYDPSKWSSAEEIVKDLTVTALAAGMGAGALKGVDSGLNYYVKKREEGKFENESANAMAELEQITAMAASLGQALPPETLDNVVQTPNVTSDMTPLELAEATLQREQMQNGLNVLPSTEGSQYAAGLRETLNLYGLGEVVTPEERAERQPMEDEGGMTSVVLERRKRQEQLDLLPFDQLPFSMSTDGRMVGLTPGQVGELDAGVVAAVGADPYAFPVEVYQPVLDSLKTWVDKYMPEARIVLNLRQLTGGEFGAHVPFVNPNTGKITHIITPRELPSFIYQTGNTKTKMEMMTALTHEFGHALKVQNFFQGVKGLGSAGIAALQKQVKMGSVEPGLLEALKQVAPEEARLLETWQGLRADVVEGRMSALEFVEKWVGTRKLGDSILGNKKLGNKSFYSWAKARLEAKEIPLEGASALELVEAAYNRDGESMEETIARNLNFDEFMAEQFSRAAYVKGDLAGSTLGKFFGKTLEQLRDLFRMLKGMRGESGEKIIAPDTTFQDWLDAQTARAQAQGVRSGKQVLPRKVLAAQKKLLAEKGLTPTGKVSKKKKLAPPPAVEVKNTRIDEKQVLEDAVYELESSGKITQKRLDMFLEQIERGELLKVRNSLQKLLGDEVNFDRENAVAPEPSREIAAFAGMTEAEILDTGLVAGAAGMWKRLGFESPYFKRWFGASQVLDANDLPLELYRGTGGRVTFLDPYGRAVQVAAESARQAFWFTDNVAGAQFYANYAESSNKRQVKEEYRRRAQDVYRQIQEATDLRAELAEENPQREIIQKRIDRLRNEAWALRNDESTGQDAKATVQGYYLKMENPLVVEMNGRGYNDTVFTGYLEQAVAGGHDGVVLRDTYDPLAGNVYAVFAPENAKGSANIGTFSDTDLLHWDRENPEDETLRKLSNKMEKLLGRGKLEAVNGFHKAMQSITQMQQLAASRPEDFNLQMFMKRALQGNTLKNNLLKPAEDLVKEMGQIFGSSSKRVEVLHDVLKAEWKEGKLAGPIHGLDADGVEVWGEVAGMSRAQQSAVVTWEVVDGPALRAFMLKQGVDVTTEEGGKVLELYLRTRNLFLYHFTELGKNLSDKAGRTYANMPLVAKQELIKIQDLMAKLLASPFVPQGNFGNYVLIVKEDKGPVPFGQQRMKVVVREHFESKALFDQAYAEAQRLKGNNLRVDVSSKVLDDAMGIPLQLPADFLEAVISSEEFGDEQIALLEDLMVESKYSKIAAKYSKMSEQVRGGSTDFVRVLADYASRNANYLWKGKSRFQMQQAISSANLRIRRMEKGLGAMTAEEKLELDASRRSVAMMKSALDYMMHPPNELQGMRSFITLVYLAYNIKTALMNVSTVAHTMFAAGSEYGEAQGAKEFAKSIKQTGQLLLHKSKLERLKEGQAVPTVEGAEMNELVGVLDKAMADGVVDQSFAYFLAAHANSSPLLAATGGKANKVGHMISELGMLPFQTMEKVNRIHSLITFYKLEKAAKATPQDAYERAVAKTNQLQNSYDAVNRPELFRGVKALFTMFMSYVQFMGWITTGGYERGARKQAELLGRSIAPAWRGTTVKVWLLYLMMGGLMGVPFARNLMDVVQWLWRKLGFGNAEAELRVFLDEMGMDANWAMHGLMHNVAGFDVSASFGLGRMLPGTDLLTKTREMSATEVMGSLVQMGSGPAGSFYKSVIESLGELADGNIREAGKKMPGAIGAVSKATDAYLRQGLAPTHGVTTKDGRRLTWDEEKGEFRDLTTGELVGMLLNFNPTLLSENRARNYAMQSELYYWQGRRSDLMDRYWQAVRSGDEKLRLEVVQAHEDFKQQVPDRKLWITGKDRAESIRTHKKQVKAGENFGTMQKKYRGVVQGVEQAYGKGGE